MKHAGRFSTPKPAPSLASLARKHCYMRALRKCSKEGKRAPDAGAFGRKRAFKVDMKGAPSVITVVWLQ
jgi:hypothetical protein